MKETAVFVRYCKQLNEEQAGQVLDLLTESDLEFVPPLSARESTTQTDLSQGTKHCEQKVPLAYFRELQKQEFLLATENDRVVGFLSFTSDREMELGTQSFTAQYISTIVVGKAYRRMGIARQFYGVLLQRYREKNIVTRTWSTNRGHLHLLRELGFALLETIENDRGDGIDTVYYGRMKTYEE